MVDEQRLDDLKGSVWRCCSWERGKLRIKIYLRFLVPVGGANDETLERTASLRLKRASKPDSDGIRSSMTACDFLLEEASIMSERVQWNEIRFDPGSGAKLGVGHIDRRWPHILTFRRASSIAPFRSSRKA